MSKERIKSFLLSVLVMMNFGLGAKLLSDKKLWPYGYNFFLSLQNSDIVRAITNTTDKKTIRMHLCMPERITVNTGDQTSRIAVNSDDEIFSEIFSAANQMISDALSSEDIRYSQKKEWLSALNGKSVCFCYPTAYDTKLLGEFFGVDADAMCEYVKALSVIVVSEDGAVFFEDFASGSFYRTETKTDSRKLADIINKTRNLYKYNNEIINYSVDLKFDEVFGTQKAVLSPGVLIYSTPAKAAYLSAYAPLAAQDAERTGVMIDKILSIFKINSGNVRRYTEINGTVVFVENNGILKINPAGLLSYQSTDSRGFYLGRSYSETVGALAELAEKVNNACMSENELYISKPLVRSEENVTFDYRVGGIPVMMDFAGQKNAVRAEIKNGDLKSYTQVLRNYILGQEKYDTPEYIEALDNAIEYYSRDMNNIEIQNMYLAYTDSGEQTLAADWKASVKSIEISEEEAK